MDEIRLVWRSKIVCKVIPKFGRGRILKKEMLENMRIILEISMKFTLKDIQTA